MKTLNSLFFIGIFFLTVIFTGCEKKEFNDYSSTETENITNNFRDSVVIVRDTAYLGDSIVSPIALLTELTDNYVNGRMISGVFSGEPMSILLPAGLQFCNDPLVEFKGLSEMQVHICGHDPLQPNSTSSVAVMSGVMDVIDGNTVMFTSYVSNGSSKPTGYFANITITEMNISVVESEEEYIFTFTNDTNPKNATFVVQFPVFE